MSEACARHMYYYALVFAFASKLSRRCGSAPWIHVRRFRLFRQCACSVLVPSWSLEPARLSQQDNAKKTISTRACLR